jgi:hypothetical protein
MAKRFFQNPIKMMQPNGFHIQEEREPMNTQAIAHIVHSLNPKRFSKPTALCLIAIFAISTLAAVSLMPAKAATPQTSALHTSGTYILDASGNVVYLRGMGVAGMAPNLILWEEDGSDNWGDQWKYNPTAAMDETFQAMQSQWNINMIRVFVYPSWYYRDNIVPAQEDPNYADQTTPISTKAYLRTLCQEADKYGIYVDIVPYMLTPSTSSFGLDTYASTGYGWQGMPMMGWDDAGTKFLTDAGYGNNEQAFWNWFWTDMANNLKDYPNAIFEAWNEPNMGSDVDAIPAGYMTYLETMYSAIRSTGATNLIMMQWHMGWQPNGYGNDLSWAAQINNAIPAATNLVYTTHYYYYAPTDLSSYWATDYATLKSQIQTGVATMGVNAPLVINEEGSCLANSPNHQNDLTWWTNVVAAQRDLNLGACAYYWLSDGGLGGVYSGETMLSSGYLPNEMGQAYISGYNGATIAAPAPTQAAAPTATETPQPTATQTEQPQATPEAANTATTTTPSQTKPQEPTNTPAATQQPEQSTLTLKPTLNMPTQLSGQSLVHHDYFRQWLSFHWPRYHFWFAYHC